MTGVLGIQNCTRTDNQTELHIMHFGFAAEIGGSKISFDKDEIMAVDFIDPQVVLQMTDKQLRGIERKECVEKLIRGELLPLEIISNFNAGKKE